VATATFFMIVIGGTVTTLEAGDAEPSWSLAFWKWFRPLDELPGGLKYELGHRMLGTFLGFLTIFMAAVLRFKDSRRWVKNLGIAAMLAVAAQGLLGALRVLAVSDPEMQERLLALFGSGDDIAPALSAIATVHATLAQLTFALMVTITLVTSRGWIAPAKIQPSAVASRMRRLGYITLILLLIQVVLGAHVRHAGGRAVMIHLVMGLIVTVHIILLSTRANRHHHEIFPIRQPAGLAVFFVLLQIFLGFGAWMMTRGSIHPPPSFTNLVRTGHVATGAMLLAIVLVVTLRSHRLLKSEASGKEETDFCLP
jgi:cytochrome c oxidase assembly protein subunit 15